MHSSTSNRRAEHRGQRRAPRRAFSLLELVVALAIFGMILMGIFPLIVMQSRGVSRLESRSPSDKSWYLVPATDPWARKLGAAAALTFVDPGPPPTPDSLVVDDGASGYVESDGNWTVESDAAAWEADYRRHEPTIDANQTATWTMSGMTPAWYDIRLTWMAAANLASNATFTIYDGETLVGTYTLDQRAAPSGATFQNRAWQTLAMVVIQSGTAKVQLSTEADGPVVADAVRMVPVQNVLSVQSYEHALSSEEVTARVFVNVQVP